MKWLLLLAALLVALAGVVALAAVDRAGVPPRRLAPYLERRASGHRAEIEGAAHRVASVLVALDRGGERNLRGPVPIPRWTDATTTAPENPANVVLVTSVEEARHAITQAKRGDTITFVPGVYRFHGNRKADLTAGYTFPMNRDRMNLRLYGTVENLFDYEYFENGFRTPGRNGRIGITFAF